MGYFNYIPNNDNRQMLKEAYYGKTKNLKEVDKKFNIVVEKINKVFTDPNYEVTIKALNKVLNNEIRDIENLFKKEFKVKEFYLSMYSSIPLGNVVFRFPNNAYTFAKGFNIFRPSKKENKNTVKGTSDFVIGVAFDIGLVHYSDLTGEELAAIIMHEIGHNMERSSLSIFRFLSPHVVGNVIQLFAIENIFPYMMSLNKWIEDVLTKNPALYNLFKFFNNIEHELSVILQPVGNFIALPNLIARIGSQGVVEPLIGYGSEMYSDSFASSYGYAVPLSSALNKLNEKRGSGTANVIKNAPIINLLYDFSNVTTSLVVGIIDVHPHTVVRVNNQLKKLKRDLKDDSIDPRMKKEIQADIDDMEKFINNEYQTYSHSKHGPRIFSFLYNKLITDGFKGNADLRDALRLTNVEA
jgi:hypothetical protein